jgi:hypothetical protein
MFFSAKKSYRAGDAEASSRKEGVFNLRREGHCAAMSPAPREASSVAMVDQRVKFTAFRSARDMGGDGAAHPPYQ